MRLKRLSYGAAGLSLLAILTLGARTTWSYLKASHQVIQEEIEDSIPLPFQLRRLKQMVDDLVPEVQRNRVALAEAEVDVANLEKEFRDRKRQLDEAREHIVKRRAMLSEAADTFFIGGRKYTRQEVEMDLAARLDRYNVVEEQSAAKERLLAARQKVVEAATRKLRSYQRDQQQMEVRVAELESQLNLVESMKDSHELEFNYTKLAESKLLADYLNRKLDVAQKVLASTAIAEEGISDDEHLARNVVEEVDAKFGLREADGPKPTDVGMR